MAHRRLEVAIVGGAIVGLALAHALKRAGIRVAVYAFFDGGGRASGNVLVGAD
jgi:2-polyprenyl-6-methoxyphenol hydroxylase-like FAD-dependent oxidoreductase